MYWKWSYPFSSQPLPILIPIVPIISQTLPFSSQTLPIWAQMYPFYPKHCPSHPKHCLYNPKCTHLIPNITQTLSISPTHYPTSTQMLTQTNPNHQPVGGMETIASIASVKYQVWHLNISRGTKAMLNRGHGGIRACSEISSAKSHSVWPWQKVWATLISIKYNLSFTTLMLSTALVSGKSVGLPNTRITDFLPTMGF